MQPASTIGTLHVRISLDQPLRIHFGPDEPIVGAITVTYEPHSQSHSANTSNRQSPSSRIGNRGGHQHTADPSILHQAIPQAEHAGSNELFGPLKIQITLRGNIRTYITNQDTRYERSDCGTTATVPLFYHAYVHYDDSCRIQASEDRRINFMFKFPALVQEPFEYPWPPHRQFNLDPKQELPPSFQLTRPVGRIKEAEVEYVLEYRVSMPGIPVEIVRENGTKGVLLYYGSPMVQAPHEDAEGTDCGLGGSLEVRNQLLVPEHQRPKGIRQKWKSALTVDAFGVYAFDWLVEVPFHLYIGQPILMKIMVAPRDGRNTAVVIPAIEIIGIEAVLQNDIDVRTQWVDFTGKGCVEDAYMPTHVVSLLADGVGATISRDDNWTKWIQTSQLDGRGITSSFSSPILAVGHTLIVTVKLRCAGETTSKEEKFKVVVHPPLVEQDQQASRGASGSGEVGGYLPRYEELWQQTSVAPPAYT